MYYDSRHMPLLLNSGIKIYLKLHNGYEFPSRFNNNKFQQRCGPSINMHSINQLSS